MKTVAICQARMGSTRLPGKVLKDISGRPTLDWVVEAAKQSPGVDQVVVATSTLPQDDPIVEWALAKGVAVFRGSETDVLSRFLGAARQHNADIIVRLTGDCPFLDPRVIGEVIKLREMKNADYATNTDPPSYPDGLDVEVFTRATLEASNKEAIRRTDRDTVTRFMVRNRHRFSAANLVCPLPDLVRERWVLDSQEDYDFIQEIAKRWYWIAPRITDAPSYLDILKILDDEPELRKLNSHLSRNERFYEDLKQETTTRSYKVSAQCLKQAEHLIPLGAQTFSKSKLMFPEGVAPLFVTHGDGGYVFDVDGNDYVDLVGGLLPNVLGYRDPDVDQAIRDQLSRGISFSLATPLEEELAEKLNYHIPSAEMVRFGKNGSDVTTAGIRLARHITKLEEILVRGYHGWHSWTTENHNGVTVGERDDSFREAKFSDISILGFAAVIIEPEFLSIAELKYLREECDKAGCLLIFDEIISGFRCGMGGLQKEYGVTPDLSTFGKAMANGMPISALVGLEKYMKRMPEISYSGTFFGETLSIAAAIATIDKLATLQVHDKLFTVGEVLRDQINTLIKQYNVEGIELYSRPELNRIKFRDKHLQSVFIQEMAKNSVLIIGSHNTCYAHNKPELDRVISAWDSTLKAISAGVKLEGEVIKGKAVR